MSQELLAVAERVAVRAGELAASRRATGVDVAGSKSSPEDIVTLADRETEELIRSLLADERPGDGFFGEEGTADAGTSGLTWVVDPIDGTVNYAYGLPQYAVSVAVVEGEPDPATWTALAGVVVCPPLDEVYAASASGGSVLNGRPLAVRETALSMALVATGFSYSAEIRREQAAVVGELIGSVRDIRRIGSAALDLCSVAAGRVDAYFERRLNPWDHAAGALIAVEAGAVVTGIDGGRGSHEFLLAAPPRLAEELGGMLRRLHPELRA